MIDDTDTDREEKACVGVQKTGGMPGKWWCLIEAVKGSDIWRDASWQFFKTI